MKKILVTGANGQLGRCIKDVVVQESELSFVFATKEELDISKENEVSEYFNSKKFDYCINTAAYTNVENAEKEVEKAFAINAEGAKYIAKACADNNTTLIHISTDYVFDGEKDQPYTETDTTNPINVYGASKLKGEKNVKANCEAHYIIRTSWLYSTYGHNFFNTILKHANMGTRLTITTEQTGVPTNANDLAEVIMLFIKKDPKQYGVYHYSNEGEATWYDFAIEILTQHSQLTTTNIAKTDHYPTFAKRPKNSVLSSLKLTTIFMIKPLHWKKSLSKITK